MSVVADCAEGFLGAAFLMGAFLATAFFAVVFFAAVFFATAFFAGSVEVGGGVAVVVDAAVLRLATVSATDFAAVAT